VAQWSEVARLRGESQQEQEGGDHRSKPEGEKVESTKGSWSWEWGGLEGIGPPSNREKKEDERGGSAQGPAGGQVYSPGPEGPTEKIWLEPVAEKARSTFKKKKKQPTQSE